MIILANGAYIVVSVFVGKYLILHLWAVYIYYTQRRPWFILLHVLVHNSSDLGVEREAAVAEPPVVDVLRL